MTSSVTGLPRFGGALELRADQCRADPAPAKAVDQVNLTQVQPVGEVDDLNEANDPTVHADDSRLPLFVPLTKEGDEAVLVPSADLCEMLLRALEIERERKGIVVLFRRSQAKIAFRPIRHGSRRRAGSGANFSSNLSTGASPEEDHFAMQRT